MEPTNTSDTSSQPIKSERSKVGVIWIALAGFTILLLLLGIFIGQNSQQVNIRYLGLHAELAFGLALLFAAISGAILTLLIGTIRIMQLRRKHD